MERSASVTRNEFDDLPIAHAKSPIDMSDEEQFYYYVKKAFPPRLSKEIKELYPDFDINYKDRLFAIQKKRRNYAFFYGEVGTGKTFSAIMAFILHCPNHWGMMYSKLSVLELTSFFLKLQKYMNDKIIYFELIEKAKDVFCLIIDDLGANKQTEWNLAILEDIVNHRYNHNLSTMVTSNYSIAQLTNMGYSRLISRIESMAGDNILFFEKNLRSKPQSGRRIR